MPHQQSIDEGQLALDIYQTDKEIIILAPIAGIQENELDISVTDEVLIIKGSRKLEREILDENYYTKECFWGNFSRSIVLPENVDLAKIQATFENGILEIHVPKVEKIRTKVVRIKTR